MVRRPSFFAYLCFVPIFNFCTSIIHHPSQKTNICFIKIKMHTKTTTTSCNISVSVYIPTHCSSLSTPPSESPRKICRVSSFSSSRNQSRSPRAAIYLQCHFDRIVWNIFRPLFRNHVDTDTAIAADADTDTAGNDNEEITQSKLSSIDHRARTVPRKRTRNENTPAVCALRCLIWHFCQQLHVSEDGIRSVERDNAAENCCLDVGAGIGIDRNHSDSLLESNGMDKSESVRNLDSYEDTSRTGSSYGAANDAIGINSEVNVDTTTEKDAREKLKSSPPTWEQFEFLDAFHSVHDATETSNYGEKDHSRCCCNEHPDGTIHIELFILPPGNPWNGNTPDSQHSNIREQSLRTERIFTSALVRLENQHIKLQTLNAFTATMGGGYFLCRFLSTAVQLARYQRKIALALDDIPLAMKCTINEAYNYIHAGKIDYSNKLISIVENEAKYKLNRRGRHAYVARQADYEIVVGMCQSAKWFGERVLEAGLKEKNLEGGKQATNDNFLRIRVMKDKDGKIP